MRCHNTGKLRKGLFMSMRQTHSSARTGLIQHLAEDPHWNGDMMTDTALLSAWMIHTAKQADSGSVQRAGYAQAGGGDHAPDLRTPIALHSEAPAGCQNVETLGGVEAVIHRGVHSLPEFYESGRRQKFDVLLSLFQRSAPVADRRELSPCGMPVGPERQRPSSRCV